MYLSPLFSSQSKSFVIATIRTQRAETCFFSCMPLLQMMSVKFQWLDLPISKIIWDANHVPFLVVQYIDGRRLGTKFHIRYVKVSSFFRELQHQRIAKIDRGGEMGWNLVNLICATTLQGLLLYKRVLSSPYLIFSRRGGELEKLIP